MKKNIFTFRQGFTLLELLVTISIIGILLGVGSVSFSTAQKRGRDSRRKADMRSIQKSLEQCYALDTEYPQTVVSSSSLDCDSGESTMDLVPADPKPDSVYVYSVDSDPATTYCLCATLENVDTGNATSTGASGACVFATGSGADYFCISSQQ